MDSLLKDIRYAIRSLLKHPAFTAMALITLALGIGANTAIFSVFYAVLLRPLPYKDPSRLVMLWTDDTKRDLHEEGTSPLTVADWRSQSQSFTEMAVFSRNNPVTLMGGEELERVDGQFVTANLFPMLGVIPALGRTFTVEDEQLGEQVVILSYAFWQRRFGGSAKVIGRTLQLDGDMTAQKKNPRTVRVIGVMPADFYFSTKETQLWEPVTTYWRWDKENTVRSYGDWRVIGRLKPGTTLRKAQGEMTGIGQRLAQAYPIIDPDFAGFGVRLVPVLDQITGKKLQLALWVLVGAVVFVLLIACANVANLLLAHGAARQRELTIRTALGAGRTRLLRQLLTESVMLAAVAGLLGLGLAAVGVRALSALAPPGIPRLDEISIDSGVLVFTVGLSFLAGIVFGLAPAWKMSRQNPSEVLKETSRNSSGGLRLRKMRGLLVVVECALSIVLLSGAGLLLRSFQRLQSVDSGFNAEGVLLVRVSLPPVIGNAEGQNVFVQREVAFHQITERIAGVPGVRGAGAISSFLTAGNADESITIEGRPPAPEGTETGQLASESVSPGFFQTMGIPLLRGRLFSRDDAALKIALTFNSFNTEPGAPPNIVRAPSTQPSAAIINETFARRYFHGEDPIGKRFYEGQLTGKYFWYEIVGVVGDVHRQGLEQQPIPEYFVPLTNGVNGTAEFAVRADHPLSLLASVRQAIHSVDKNAMILTATTVDRQMGELSAQRRFQTWLLTLFAVLAMVLSAIGAYGVMHYSVSQRTHEMGVRIALGAQTSDVLRLVIGQGLKVVASGVVIGLLLSLWLTDLMSHLLFDVSAHDPLTFVGAALTLLGVSFLACYIPARRATKVDPLVALRYE
jgi:predicted permease